MVYIYSTWWKQQYNLCLRKFVHTNLPQVGFELGSLGPQAGTLPIELPLLVVKRNFTGRFGTAIYFGHYFTTLLSSFSRVLLQAILTNFLTKIEVTKLATFMHLDWPFILAKTRPHHKCKKLKVFSVKNWNGTTLLWMNQFNILSFVWTRLWNNFWNPTLLNVSPCVKNVPFTKFWLPQNFFLNLCKEKLKGLYCQVQTCFSNGKLLMRMKEPVKEMLYRQTIHIKITSFEIPYLQKDIIFLGMAYLELLF